MELAIEQTKEAVSMASQKYFEKMNRYPVGTVQEKFENLQLRIKDISEPLFNHYSCKVEKLSIKKFESDAKSFKIEQLSEHILNEISCSVMKSFHLSLQGMKFKHYIPSFSS